ncbi:MAG: signal peptidase II [Polyangiaceae bacterium]
MRGLLMVLVLALVGCDHATKVVAKITLEGSAPRALITGVLDLQYAENRDTAFSLLRNVATPAKGSLILVMSCLAIAAIAAAWWKRRRVAGLLEHAAFVLVVGGAIGNVLDRIEQGYVIDFIHLRRWPVFNVADVAICVGGALVGVVMMRLKKRDEGGLRGPEEL